MTIDIELAVTLAVNLLALLAGIIGAVRWLRSWIREQIAEPIQRTETEVSTKSGHTMGQVVEQLGTQMQSHVNTLNSRFNEIEHDLRPLLTIQQKLSEMDERFTIIDKRITQTSDIALYALSNGSQALEKLAELERNRNA